jgi:hypothetical protein
LRAPIRQQIIRSLFHPGRAGLFHAIRKPWTPTICGILG